MSGRRLAAVFVSMGLVTTGSWVMGTAASADPVCQVLPDWIEDRPSQTDMSECDQRQTIIHAHRAPRTLPPELPPLDLEPSPVFTGPRGGEGGGGGGSGGGGDSGAGQTVTSPAPETPGWDGKWDFSDHPHSDYAPLDVSPCRPLAGFDETYDRLATDTERTWRAYVDALKAEAAIDSRRSGGEKNLEAAFLLAQNATFVARDVTNEAIYQRDQKSQCPELLVSQEQPSPDRPVVCQIGPDGVSETC
jgi:hypothetical protein